MNIAVATYMNTCQNCGQVNAAESQFCRFCGTKFLQQDHLPEQLSQPRQYEYEPPQPYSWKTDEFQTKSDSRRTAADRPQPRSLAQLPGESGFGHAPMVSRGAQFMDPNYRCPHCMSQFLPRTDRRISTAGWIVFAVLLVAFFPLFWVGLLIKEDVHICPSCSTRIGK